MKTNFIFLSKMRFDKENKEVIKVSTDYPTIEGLEILIRSHLEDYYCKENVIVKHEESLSRGNKLVFYTCAKDWQKNIEVYVNQQLLLTFGK